MAINVNSGLTTAAITGTITASAAIPTPSATQTIVNAVTTGNGATYTSIYTVPAGKIFYLMAIWAQGTAGGCTFKNSAESATIAVLYASTTTNALLNPATPIYKFLANENVRCIGSNGVVYGVIGFTVDA